MVKRALNTLNKGLFAFNNAKGNIEAQIVDKVEFEFSIDYNPADGWIMIAFKDHNAALEPLLRVIKEKGVLTENDYMCFSI
jgi:hypothetical protein